mmetsp:Transcript_10556/g.11609  ORF Transcript_10556/g.11609 Transcript_10556/m.11609 type:complete len:200 (-) Transcript_10556:127-726(-)
MEQPQHIFKVLFIGDSGVGKTSMLLRLVSDEFIAEQPATIGVDFQVYNQTIDGKEVGLTVWDTAGQEKFRSLTESYYRGTQGIILVYDVTREESFQNLDSWLEEADLFATNKDIVKVLIGNKIDMEGREISTEAGKQYADEKGLLFIETSSKTGTGVKNAVDMLTRKILQTPGVWKTPRRSKKIQVEQQHQTEDDMCYC